MEDQILNARIENLSVGEPVVSHVVVQTHLVILSSGVLRVTALASVFLLEDLRIRYRLGSNSQVCTERVVVVVVGGKRSFSDSVHQRQMTLIDPGNTFVDRRKGDFGQVFAFITTTSVNRRCLRFTWNT